jgi:hypothetical protein
MPTCFVIQPFDAGKFDKRYEQVFKPAIVAAGLEPYRVDQDDRVDVPIDAIETGIREAAVCLADISTDNPNVWYELGYAYAVNRTVIMVCGTGREKYPFDIQHRTIIRYEADAPEDFAALQKKITARLVAALQKAEALNQIESESVAPIAGLSQGELVLLAVLAGEVITPDSGVGVYSLQKSTEKEGLTKTGFALALRRLQVKSMVQDVTLTNNNDYDYPGIRVADKGWDWIDANEERFVLKRPEVKFTDDDIPF